MKEMDLNLDENQLWQICFPNLYRQSGKEGSYIIPDLDEQIKKLKDNGGGYTALERAFSRLELAVSSIWPYVESLFCLDFFPHRLVAATDLLRAVDFGEVEDMRMAALARELAMALDDVENLLAAGGNRVEAEEAEDG